jgi:hypothetical protein
MSMRVRIESLEKAQPCSPPLWWINISDEELLDMAHHLVDSNDADIRRWAESMVERYRMHGR